MMKKFLAVAGMLSLLVVPAFAADEAAPAAAAPAAAAPAADAPAADSAAPAAAGTPVKKTHKVPAVAGDEAGVKAAFDRFSQAWAAGDAKARAAVFTSDSSVINPFGKEAWGRAEITKLFEMETDGFAKGTTHTFDNFKMSFVMGTIAFVDCDGTISGIKSPSGEAVPDQKVHLFVVAVKRTKDWQFRFARPTIYAPMPGEAPAAAVPAAAEPAMSADKADTKKSDKK